MAESVIWLNLPQAVVLEATRDIDCVRDLTDDDPTLLLIKASQALGYSTTYPVQQGDVEEEHRYEADKKLDEIKTAMRLENRYLLAGQRLQARLIAGVRTKASRTPAGPYESIDPVEYTRAELCGVDAVDTMTKRPVLFGLRIEFFDLVESLTDKSVNRPTAGIAPSQVQEEPPRQWTCQGDPLPHLIEWGRSKWGEDLQHLPNRERLLLQFRDEFGLIRGVNEKTMRELRRVLMRKRHGGGTSFHRR
jgi:hypothetical protein